jgi:hypothetical protein
MVATVNKHNHASGVPSRGFVAPLPVSERRQAESFDVSQYMQGDVIHVGDPLAAHHGATEQTSGYDRSVGLILRLIPFTGVWLILTIGVVWVSGVHGAWGLLLFAVLTALSYGAMDRREYTYSRGGLERHKVDTLADLKELELNQAHELRKLVVQAQIKMWEGQYHDGQFDRLTDRGRAITIEGSAVRGRITGGATRYLEVGTDEEASES